jgi:hypothetical protein
VRVIGAHVIAVSTSIAASRVSTQSGRRSAGGPRSAQTMSPRATTPGQCGLQVVRLPPQWQDPGEPFDRPPSAGGPPPPDRSPQGPPPRPAQKFRPARPFFFGQSVQALAEVVVELNEHWPNHPMDRARSASIGWLDGEIGPHVQYSRAQPAFRCTSPRVHWLVWPEGQASTIQFGVLCTQRNPHNATHTT